MDYRSDTIIPFDVTFVSLRRDLPILQYAIEGIKRHTQGVENFYVVTKASNLALFKRKLPTEVFFFDEDQILPGMTLRALGELPLPHFPKAAGWYYQQFLKFEVAASVSKNINCLIWDSDTVLLRPMTFFDHQARTLFTKANEYHAPYFETFDNLFGFTANREFSFISQHIMLNKPILNEMFEAIHRRYPGDKHWSWKIMEATGSQGINLFSEYETYGHYMKHFHSDKMAFRELPWTRSGAGWFGSGISYRRLNHLKKDYYFSAFEVNRTLIRTFAAKLKRGFKT